MMLQLAVLQPNCQELSIEALLPSADSGISLQGESP